MRAGLPIQGMGGEQTKGFRWFSRFANSVAKLTGHPITFIVSVIIVLIWAITGPLFHFSDTWQLVINTGTTIVTFLMVFLIQATQNRDTVAIQLKLDELIMASANARNELACVEDEAPEEIAKRKDDLKRDRDIKSVDPS